MLQMGLLVCINHAQANPENTNEFIFFSKTDEKQVYLKIVDIKHAINFEGSYIIKSMVVNDQIKLTLRNSAVKGTVVNST